MTCLIWPGKYRLGLSPCIWTRSGGQLMRILHPRLAITRPTVFANSWGSLEPWKTVFVQLIHILRTASLVVSHLCTFGTTSIFCIYIVYFLPVHFSFFFLLIFSVIPSCKISLFTVYCTYNYTSYYCGLKFSQLSRSLWKFLYLWGIRLMQFLYILYRNTDVVLQRAWVTVGNTGRCNSGPCSCFSCCYQKPADGQQCSISQDGEVCSLGYCCRKNDVVLQCSKWTVANL